MRKSVILFFCIILIFLITGCSNAPSSKMKDEQYSIINENVIKVLGNDYGSMLFIVGNHTLIYPP
ncbi:MAG: hypothetical protein WCJ01_10080, partial [Ignavibacteria bacterium]